MELGSRAGTSKQNEEKETGTGMTQTRMPAFFFGHGWAIQQSEEPVRLPVEGVDGGSISMLSVRVG